MTRAAVIGLSGPVLTLDECTMLRALRPVGVILFRRNVVDQAQVAGLVASVRDVLGGSAPVLVDQEGGRVARLRPPHWPAFPPAAAFAGGSAAAVRESARAMGGMCRAAGLDVVCAPVLDVRVPGAHDVIGDRSFGGDPREVARLGLAMVEGLWAAGVTPVIKHIPGHGRALADSHHELPRVDADVEALGADLHPFRIACANDGGAGVWAMTAHVVYPAWDAAWPATVSARIIGEVIRGQVGFEGVLVSDDVAMGALAGVSHDLAGAVIGAGCDLVLHCSGRLEESAAILRATPALRDATGARLEAARAIARRESCAGGGVMAGAAGPDPTATGRDQA